MATCALHGYTLPGCPICRGDRFDTIEAEKIGKTWQPPVEKPLTGIQPGPERYLNMLENDPSLDYWPSTYEAKLGWLVEECGEVLAAVGKSTRFGLLSVNPELPESEQETNGDWVLRELKDLRQAIDVAETAILRRMEEMRKPLP